VTSRVKFLEMDALNMSFEDNSFDYVIMSDVLEHIPNTKKLLSEVLRVTKG
jgi:ubiquinone/menaquinone biosynthesis C-methylase UbiE